MKTAYYSLGPSESNALIKLIRIVFGILCIGIAIFWTIYNIRSSMTDRMLWITVLFIACFGLYQIWAGLGRAVRFIEISNDKIILRKNSLLPQKEMKSGEIKKIEIFPLNLMFYLQNGVRRVLRFGTTYTDSIDPIKNDIEEFAAINNISVEIIEEEL